MKNNDIIYITEEEVNSPEFREGVRGVEFNCDANKRMAKPKTIPTNPKPLDFLTDALTQFYRSSI